MHPQMQRLYEAALILKSAERPTDVARLLEESPQTIKNWESRGISQGGLLKAQKKIGCRAEWLSSGTGSMVQSAVQEPQPVYLADNPDFPAIRRVKIKLVAGVTGFGVDVDHEEDAPIVFRREWFVRNGYRPDKLIALSVKGSSMEPGLFAGDTVVVNTADTTPSDGDVFAVNYEGEDVVKRLVRDDGQWWLCSDNPDQRRFPRKVANGSAIIVGKVVHKQSERI